MNTQNKRILSGAVLLLLVFLASGLGACSKSQSYSELLREEERAVNRFLSGEKILNEIPADSVSFITGADAPYYRLDEDGYLYMQVVSKGEMSDKVEAGDIVYFRFNRLNLKAEYYGYNPEWQGSQNELSGSADTSCSFVYKNQYLQSTTTWGLGVQWPLKFLGYNSEVNLVLRSYYGFADDQTSCIPYLINIKYFRPEY